MVGVSGWGDGDCVSEAELRDPGESGPAAAAKWAVESQALSLAVAAETAAEARAGVGVDVQVEAEPHGS